MTIKKKEKTAKVALTKKNAVEKPRKKSGAKLKIKQFLVVAEKVIDDLKGELFILTDEELVFLINEQLEPVDKICKNTFEAWKRRAKNNEKTEEIDKDKKELFGQFSTLIKKAMIIERKSLFKKMLKDPVGWTRFAWIIERKFSEWNLKHISEVDNNVSLNGNVTFYLPNNGRDSTTGRIPDKLS